MHQPRSKHRIPVLFALAICLLSPTVAVATMTLPLSLEQLSQRATLVFYGTVIDNRSIVEEERRLVTLTTFRVNRLVKGKTGPTHTIKQIGGTLSNGRSLHVQGVPRYDIGEEYVVFLPSASRLGFTSPLGLQQGNFMVATESDEKLVYGGGRFHPAAAKQVLTTRTDDPGTASLDDFIQAIQQYNQ
jgi:hypothetical protein